MGEIERAEESERVRARFMRGVKKLDNKGLASHIRGLLLPDNYQHALEREALARILEILDKGRPRG